VKKGGRNHSLFILNGVPTNTTQSSKSSIDRVQLTFRPSQVECCYILTVSAAITWANNRLRFFVVKQ